ncbi:MAG: amidohydrolase family protein [Anaerolineae bacterium]
MRYLDANCCLGRYAYWRGREPTTPEDLIRVMDHHGLHEALVLGSLSRECHPIEGNEQVMRLTEGQPRLHPAWATLPPHGRDVPPPADLLAEMDARGVRALFLLPQLYGFTLDDWCVDSILGPFAERRVPVFYCPNGLVGDGNADMADWAGLVRMCRAFPDLPVVLTESRVFRKPRAMVEAMAACPNLHVELSALWLHRIVEFIVREFGAERLVFGTGLPARDPAVALTHLSYSEIAKEDLSAIAGGNLRRLLSWGSTPLPQPEVDFPEPTDELHALVRARGSWQGLGVLCGHGHLGRYSYCFVPEGSAGELVAEMDRLGVERAILFPNIGLTGDEVWGNDEVAAAMRAYPGRFVGLALINLHRTPEETRRELDRCFAMGMSGIKMHPGMQNYDTNGPAVEFACAYADAHRCIILNHDWGRAERMRYLCNKYPNATFITGHTNLEAAGLMSEVDNLYIGTCPLTSYGILEELVAKAGAERILYSSDQSWDAIAWNLGPILYANIPAEAKRLILGGNLRRLLAQHGL